MDKSHLLRRHALGHQLLFDVVIHIERAIPMGRGEVAENQLRPFLGLRIMPDLQHIFYAGVDLALRVVRQFRVGQPLV